MRGQRSQMSPGSKEWLRIRTISRSAISWPVIGQKMTEPILVGDCDGFCLSTTSDFYGCNAPTQPRSISSSIQFWKFNQSLTENKIESPPTLLLSKNCPFRINSISQINAQLETFIAAACSDGHVRLIRLGSRCEGDLQVDLNNFILLESP